MTEDQRKESVSREFLRILAESHGYKVTVPSSDHGVDMIVCPVTTRTEPSGKVRFLDSQFKLDFQLKATTTTGVVDAGDDIKFDLEVKNYNDLIQRRNEPLPLHLVVVVLDSAPPHCVSVDEDRLTLAGKAFWYLPDPAAEVSENARQVRVTIPKANQLGTRFISERFEQLGVDL